MTRFSWSKKGIGRTLFSGCGQVLARPENKNKPTWRNTRRYSTTSAYWLTSPLARPSPALSSHPTISLERLGQNAPRLFLSLLLYAAKRAKAIGLCLARACSYVSDDRTSTRKRLSAVSPLLRLQILEDQVGNHGDTNRNYQEEAWFWKTVHAKADYDTTSPIGLRDRAIVLCMVDLGLRASDVAGLELDGLDLAGRALRLGGRSSGKLRPCR